MVKHNNFAMVERLVNVFNASARDPKLVPLARGIGATDIAEFLQKKSELEEAAFQKMLHVERRAPRRLSSPASRRPRPSRSATSVFEAINGLDTIPEEKRSASVPVGKAAGGVALG